jgi:N-hydroxyarylamine O-acetyltransferase
VRLSDYLERVGLGGALRADLETLHRVQRAHVESIPFENLDVLLRRPVGLDAAACFEKLVARRRGGWCYEMNGLLGWALEQLGFEVTRVAAGVMRVRNGDACVGNHLCLIVRLRGEAWLLDVGFGGSLAAPLPLRQLQRRDVPYTVSLAEIGGGWWRYNEQTRADDAFSFDFRTEAADEALLLEHCQRQQTEPGSSFVENLVVQRRDGEVHHALRGRVLTQTRDAGVETQLLPSGEALVATLRETFLLDVPEAAALWASICARHEMVFTP